jgi:hypothetical protein
MVKRKAVRRVKVKYGIDPKLERIANAILASNAPAKPAKSKEAKPLPEMSKADWKVIRNAYLGIPGGKSASKMLGRAAGVELARGKRLASSGQGTKAKTRISVGDALIGAGMVSKAGADASPFDLITASKNRNSPKDSSMITGATRVGRQTRQTDSAIRATKKTLRTGKVVGGKRGSILGIAAMFASHLVGSNKKDRG